MRSSNRHTRSVRGVATFIGIAIAFALFEAVSYTAVVLGVPISSHPYLDYAAWTTPFSRFDSEAGYKLQSGTPNAGILVRRAEVQFTYTGMTANTWGFRANREYQAARDGSYRILVYGDSMTAGLYLDRPWPEQLEASLRQAGTPADVMNLSYDGGGVFNWHAHYFAKISGQVDYDMLVLAVCCDNLHRGLAIYHADSGSKAVFFAKFGDKPLDDRDFAINFLPRMSPLLQLVDKQQIDAIAAGLSSTASLPERMQLIPFDLYGTKAAIDAVRPVGEVVRKAIYEVRLALKSWLGPTYDALKRTVGWQSPQAELLERLAPKAGYEVKVKEMIADAQKRGKTVVVISVPYQKEYLFALANKKQMEPPSNKPEVERLASETCTTAVDGYSLMLAADGGTLHGFWPTYDWHWNQAGADFFVQQLTPLIGHMMKNAPTCNHRGQHERS